MTGYRFTSPTDTANRQADQMADATRDMEAYLRNARDCLLKGYQDEALRYLGFALGAAKRNGRGYAAGRILTAIQWAKRIGGA